MSLLGKFDPLRDAVINPDDFIKPVEGFPKVAVSTFSHHIIDRFIHHADVEEITFTTTANMRIPIYTIPYGGKVFAFYMSPVGAPAAACIMEEVIAMGASSFVYFGSCGVLDREIAEGHFIVPTSAIRDEGTSYHYLPKADSIELSEKGIRALTSALQTTGFPFSLSKTWTTDGIYRETRANVAQRKKQGCAVVDMECAALAAVAKFRKVGFTQFLYAADNLDAPDWEPRDLLTHGATSADKYMALALECGLEM